MRVSFLAIFCLTGTTVESFAPLQTPSFTRRSNSNHKNQATKLRVLRSDETLEERLKTVQQSWDGIKSSGIKKFFVDEIVSAETYVVQSVTAAEKALGWPPGTFMQAYRHNRDSANNLALESSPVGPPLGIVFSALP